MGIKNNYAYWTRTQKGWNIIVVFERVWEAPKIGEGIGVLVEVPLYQADQRTTWKERTRRLLLTSNCFNDQTTGVRKAFAVLEDENR